METDRIDIQTSLTECSPHWENIPLESIRLLNVKFCSPTNPTYTCENTFSSMRTVKCKSRNRLTKENLENELRCSITSLTPNLDLLIEEMDCQMPRIVAH